MSFPLDEPSHSHTRPCVDGRCVPKEAEHRTSGGRDGYHSNLAQVSSAVLKSNRFNVDAPHRRNGNGIPDGSVGGRAGVGDMATTGGGRTLLTLLLSAAALSLSLTLSLPSWSFRGTFDKSASLSFQAENYKGSLICIAESNLETRIRSAPAPIVGVLPST